MNLIKTSFLGFIVTAFKILSGLIINKFVAVYIGPSGLALIGQFQSFVQISTTVARGAINTGVVKYSSEFKGSGDEGSLERLYSTSIRICVLCSLLVFFICMFFSNNISVVLFGSSDHGDVIVFFGSGVVLFSLNSLALSFLNGLKKIRRFVYINLFQSAVGLVVSVGMIYAYSLKGALIAIAINQSVVFVFVLRVLYVENILNLSSVMKKFDFDISRKLLNYSLMALVSACVVPLSHFLIRDNIGAEIGIDKAGYWQAVWYMSSAYLMVITTTLSIYYVPKISELRSNDLLKREIFNGYAIIIPIVIIMALIIFSLKDYFVVILFSEEFRPIKHYIGIQLIGDVVKICSWLLGCVLTAKAMVKQHVLTEILFSILYVVLSSYFLSFYGLIGVFYAYLITYILHFLVMFIIVRERLV